MNELTSRKFSEDGQEIFQMIRLFLFGLNYFILFFKKSFADWTVTDSRAVPRNVGFDEDLLVALFKLITQNMSEKNVEICTIAADMG